MGTFSTEPTLIRPVPTKLDLAWFRAYVADTIWGSGADPDDDLNHEVLLRRVARVVAILGKSLLLRSGADRTRRQFEEYQRSEEFTPWGAASLLAGWDERTVPVVETTLARMQIVLAGLGRAEGGFRDEDGLGSAG